MASTEYANVVEFPTPNLRPWGLFLDNALVLPDSLFDEPTRWTLGVKFQPFDFTELELETLPSNPCTDPAEIGDPREYTDVETQAAFSLVDQVTCSTLWKTEGQLAANIAERWPLLVSEAFARELLSGSAGGGLSLSNSDTDAGATSTVAAAIAEFEERLALGLNNAQGMIHLAPSALVYGVKDGIINFQGGRYFSPGGHIVIADAGYQATETTTSVGYATGPVYYKLTDRQGRARSVDEVLDWRVAQRKNVQTVIDDAYGLILFDPNTVWSSVITKA